MSDNTARLSQADMHRIREWFDAIQDINPSYLDRRDYEIAAIIYDCLGRRVPVSISEVTNDVREQARNT